MKAKKLLTTMMIAAMGLSTVACSGGSGNSAESDNNDSANSKLNQAQKLIYSTYDDENVNFEANVDFKIKVETDLSAMYDEMDYAGSNMEVTSVSGYLEKSDGKTSYNVGSIVASSYGVNTAMKFERYIDMTDTSKTKVYDLVDEDDNEWELTETSGILGISNIVANKDLAESLQDAKVQTTNEEYIITGYLSFENLNKIISGLDDTALEDVDSKHFKNVDAQVTIKIDKKLNKITYFECNLAEAMTDILAKATSTIGFPMTVTECELKVTVTDYGTVKNLDVPQKVLDNLIEEDDEEYEFDLEDLEGIIGEDNLDGYEELLNGIEGLD